MNQDRNTQVYSPEMDAGPRHLGVLQWHACESKAGRQVCIRVFVYVLCGVMLYLLV